MAFRPSMRTFGVKIAAAEMGLCAYFLPHRRGVKFFLHVCLAYSVVAMSAARGVLLPAVLACGAHIFPCLRVGAARFLLIVYDGVQVEEATMERGSLVILIPNTLFVALFIVLAALAVLMLRRGAVAEAVCATVAAVGCVLPLVAIGLAPAARAGNMVAEAVVVAAYILSYVFTFGGAAGMFVFSRARVQSALADVAGEGK